MTSEAQTALQKRYYWAVIRHVALVGMPGANLNRAEQDLHRELKELLLGFEDVVSKSGSIELRPISTAGLSRDEFTEYIEAVISIAASAGVPFPDNAEDLLEIAPRLLPHRLPIPKVHITCD